MDTSTIKPPIPIPIEYRGKQDAIRKINQHYKRAPGTINYIYSNNVKLEDGDRVTKEFKLNAEYNKKGLIKKRQFIVTFNVSQTRDIMGLPNRDFTVSLRKVNRSTQASNDLSSKQVSELLSSLPKSGFDNSSTEC